CDRGAAQPTRPERETEPDEDRGRARRGNEPDRVPIVHDLETLMRTRGRCAAPRVRRSVAVHHRTGHECSDEITETIRNEVDQPLRRRANLHAGALVRVDLPADEEEVV